MAGKKGVKGRLSAYIVALFILGAVLALADIGIYFIDRWAGLIISCFLLIYLGVVFVLWVFNKPIMVNELVSFATEYGQIQKQLLKELALPHALLDNKGRIMWCNNEFCELFGDNCKHKMITSLIPDITEDKFPESFDEVSLSVNSESRDFQAKLKRIDLKAMITNSSLIEGDDKDFLIGLYLFDETALKIALQENDDQSLAVGMIYLDNLEEASEGVEDVRKSLLAALVDRQISKYIAQVDGIVKKTDNDKYLVILRKKTLTALREKNFDILEEVKKVSIGNEYAVTISIGIGLDGLSFAQNYEFARAAIDLALGRGGDQAVVKVPGSIQYYGGKSQQQEKNTRVKARVKAQALQEILSTKDEVYIMGHRLADVDSFGAAVGIYCVCKKMQKKAHIVLNEITPSLKPVVELFSESQEADGIIVNSATALEKVGSNAVLVVVDINKPSITDCPELIKCCKAVVVLDHHRQGTETISNATLSYVEPYASSACEMVAEILQYIDEGIKINATESDCLYSGIMIDTNNFTTKTGVRTFEAAAYLRRNGADVTRVRKLFREDASEYMAKAKTIRDTVIYRNDYALSVCDATGCQSPTIVAAQAANELLNINGVKASFVFTDYQGVIYLSARSIDELNVQVVTEKLGGGGHMNVAGAQFSGITINEAVDKLKATLDEMLENGEI